MRKGVVVDLQLQLFTGITKPQNLNAAQHIAALTAHGIAVTVLHNHEPVGIKKGAGNIAFDAAASAQAQVVDSACFTCFSSPEECGFIAVDTVGKACFVILVPGLPGVGRVNGQMRAAHNHIIAFATLQVVCPGTAHQGVVTQAAVNPVAVGAKNSNRSGGAGSIMAAGVNAVIEDAAGVIVAAKVAATALLGGWHPGVDTYPQIHLGIAKLNALDVDEVVDTVAIGHLVGHPHNCLGQVSARVFEIYPGLEFRACGQVAVFEQRHSVAFLGSTEIDTVVLPRICAAPIGAAIIKVITGTIVDVVTPGAGIDHIVALPSGDVVAPGDQSDVRSVK